MLTMTSIKQVNVIYAPVLLLMAMLLSIGTARGDVTGLPTEDTVINTGKGVFTYPNKEGDGNKPIPVWYFMPEGYSADRPILFVMHGVSRNADDYRDNWIRYARKYNVLVLSPEFSKDDFPSNEGYNFGNMITATGEFIPASEWGFTAIDNIFDYVVSTMGSEQTHYDIFGHSAGSQFVHRLITFNKTAKVNRVVLANAGWYTLPVAEFEFPYGLGGMPDAVQGIEAIFKKQVIVLLGELDNDPKHKHLRRAQEAMQQGPHRLARGLYYYELATRLAREYYKVDFNWQLVTVPNVAHSNKKMARHAARLLYRQ